MSGHNFQNFDFWGAQNFLRISSPSFRWVLPVAWPRAAALEATHRCTWQPSEATIPWSSGSWRRRRPWMQRTTTVVASEEDIGEEISRNMGFRGAGKWMKTKCGSGRNVDGLSFLSDIVFRCFQFLWRESAKKLWCFFLPLLYVFCTPFVTVFEKRILRSTFCYRRVVIMGRRLACALQSKKCSWASGVSIVVWTHVTAVFLQVSWFEPKFLFPVTASSAVFGQLHEIPGAVIFKLCGVPIMGGSIC